MDQAIEHFHIVISITTRMGAGQLSARRPAHGFKGQN